MPLAKDRLTTAQWILERNLAWIEAADAKVAIIVTINVAMLGGLAGTFGWSDTPDLLGLPCLRSSSNFEWLWCVLRSDGHVSQNGRTEEILTVLCAGRWHEFA